MNRQDFPPSKDAFPALYQQSFETQNGFYHVQRQDYTNTNNVPFLDPYSGLYANRFSKINHMYGNVSEAYTPLPKLFMLACVPHTEYPNLSICLPNYDCVMPASNFGKEFQARRYSETKD